MLAVVQIKYKHLPPERGHKTKHLRERTGNSQEILLGFSILTEAREDATIWPQFRYETVMRIPPPHAVVSASLSRAVMSQKFRAVNTKENARNGTT